MRTRERYGSAAYRIRAGEARDSASEMAEGRDKVMMLEIADVYSQMADDRARFEEAEDRADSQAHAQIRWLSALGDRINRSFGLTRIRSKNANDRDRHFEFDDRQNQNNNHDQRGW